MTENNAILFPSSKRYIQYGDEDGYEFEESQFNIRVVNNGYILEDNEGALHAYTDKKDLLSHIQELI